MQGIRVHVIGAGHATVLPLSYLAFNEHVTEVTIESRNSQKVNAIIDDLEQAGIKSYCKFRNDTLLNVNPDIIIIAFGRTIRSGESREQLLVENSQAILDRLSNRPLSDSFVLVLTNPVDIFVDLIRIKFKISSSKIVGIGGDLDANRIRWAIKNANAQILSLGEHSESSIILIDGLPLETFSNGLNISDKIRTSLSNQLKECGAPTYTPGISVVHLLDNIIYQRRAIHLVSIYHRDWDGVITWPTIIEGTNATPYNINLSEEIQEKISQIAKKNKILVQSALYDKAD